MKTTTLPPRISRDETTLILRLERINKDVSSLREKLNSYICEPKTHGLFEQMESLKSRMEGIRRSNREIINTLQGRKQSFEGYMEKVVTQFKEFQELERNVLEYIGRAKMHC